MFNRFLLMATVTAAAPGRILRSQEDLFSCRVSLTRDGMMALLSYQHDRRGAVAHSLHPVMGDGVTLGAIGQWVHPADLPDVWADDVTDYVIR